MRRTVVTGILIGLWVLQAAGQVQPTVSVTVGVWPEAATLNALFLSGPPPPTSSVTYPVASVVCGQPKQPQPTNVVNPSAATYDDPSDASKDCVVQVGAQVTALAPGMYRSAVMANGALTPSAWGPPSDPFERRLGPPLTPSKARMR